jgi:hypothetical protein
MTFLSNLNVGDKFKFWGKSMINTYLGSDNGHFKYNNGIRNKSVSIDQQVTKAK